MATEIEEVECPECGWRQPDMGRGVCCEECGFGPMPRPENRGEGGPTTQVIDAGAAFREFLDRTTPREEGKG